MENLELELKLTVAHVNAILQHLSKGVYSEVADLISHLHSQSVPQVQAAAAAAPAPAPAPSEEPTAPTE